MILNNTYARVYWIKCGSNSGTGFLIDIDSKRYFITAKHVVDEFSDSNPILYSKDYSWHTLPVNVVWLSDDPDIAIFAPKIRTRPWAPDSDVECDPGGVMIGQDLFFVGFPFGMFTDHLGLNDGFPIGLVKKASFSGVDSKNDIYYLDGTVNKGFSGCPVIAKTQNSSKDRIIAVIEGYYGKKSNVLENGEKTDLEVEYNSGIIKAHNIRLVVDKIREYQNGYPLSW